MLSMHVTPEYVQQGIQAGALGYVLKDGVRDELVPAIRSLYQGDLYFSKQIAEVARQFIQ